MRLGRERVSGADSASAGNEFQGLAASRQGTQLRVILIDLAGLPERPSCSITPAYHLIRIFYLFACPAYGISIRTSSSMKPQV